MKFWQELDEKLGIEHKFNPDEVITMSSASMASLIMTIETGLQIINKTQKIIGSENAIEMSNTLLRTMHEIMEEEIKKQKGIRNKTIEIDTGKRTIN